MGKKWKKAKKRLTREHKYIIRFLKKFNVTTTFPPRWDMIHVDKIHDPIRSVKDIEQVVLMYDSTKKISAEEMVYNMLGHTEEAERVIANSRMLQTAHDNLVVTNAPRVFIGSNPPIRKDRAAILDAIRSHLMKG